METLRFTDQFRNFVKHSIRLTDEAQAAAILLLLEGTADWKRLKNLFETANKQYWEERALFQESVAAAAEASEKNESNSPAPLPHLIVVANTPEELQGAIEEGFDCIDLEMKDFPTNERLTQALLEAVSDELIPTRSSVVTLYGGFGADEIDSISLTHLDEHFDRLTIHDIRNLQTSVPLDVFKAVVDLAIEIGRDGREGKPVGTLFIIGDSKKVMEQSVPAGFDPVRGYSREERDIRDAKVREGIKEIAQLDGAFIISSKGIVEASCRNIVSTAKNITLSKGLGTRHWAAAAISKSCKAVSVSVSQSGGTVRIFQNGEIVLRIEPTKRRPIVLHEFDEN
ncbi:MAG: diadenylate cyclase [Thermoguttaceae bacterium]|nr:diadenylate cyclase [Thermoguttaceae bacterium]